MAAETARYARAIKASRRVHWDIDADVPCNSDFHMTESFLPPGLSLVDQLLLTTDERRLIGQVQGRTYSYRTAPRGQSPRGAPPM